MAAFYSGSKTAIGNLTNVWKSLAQFIRLIRQRLQFPTLSVLKSGNVVSLQSGKMVLYYDLFNQIDDEARHKC